MSLIYQQKVFKLQDGYEVYLLCPNNRPCPCIAKKIIFSTRSPTKALGWVALGLEFREVLIMVPIEHNGL